MTQFPAYDTVRDNNVSRSPGLFTSVSGKRKTDQKANLYMSRHFCMNKQNYGEMHTCIRSKVYMIVFTPGEINHFV